MKSYKLRWITFRFSDMIYAISLILLINVTSREHPILPASDIIELYLQTTTQILFTNTGQCKHEIHHTAELLVLYGNKSQMQDIHPMFVGIDWNNITKQHN